MERFWLGYGIFRRASSIRSERFYITGESYAGHYIPAFATQINQKNKNGEGIHINLKGIAIGNGLTNPAIQYKAYPDYALDMKLIDQSTYNALTNVASDCAQELQACDTKNSSACGYASWTCSILFYAVLGKNDSINFYDIQKKCVGDLCYDFSDVEKFLNKVSVKKVLGVGDIQFVSCSDKVHEAMSIDYLNSFEVGIPALLQDGIRLLVYAGEYDLICNWLGNSRWVDQMEWLGQKVFQLAPWIPFAVEGEEAGLQKSFGPLIFLKVYNAGHMVPMDQPKASLEMLTRWIHGLPL